MSNALKVLHVYSGNLFGGVERMLISLFAADDSKCASHFALCFDGKLSRELRADGAAVSLLGSVRLRNPWSALRARNALQRLLRERPFDIVVCHSIWTYCIFAPVLARAAFPAILFQHDIPNPKGVFYRWAWRTPPALCIANSAITAESLAQLRPEVAIRVVHPLVPSPRPPEPDVVRRLRAQWGATDNNVVILLASRFEALKGHKNLLEALRGMRDVEGWRCWIAGAPQRPEEEAYKRELEERIRTLQLSDRVNFIGHRDDMETVLAACDVCCQPNESPDAFGLVFVEALYAGRPVVGRAIGGAREIVTPECGILCPPGAPALTAALRRLVEDQPLRERMSAAGPARARALCAPEVFRRAFLSAVEGVRRRP